MNFLKAKQVALIFLGIGALGGFLYWRFVGCQSGTCPIKSVWYWSTLWGAAVGYLLGDSVNDYILKRKKRFDENDRKI
ncbi:DUF6132 family protein [uncultured Draconibacterium sp.]|uniref:DUF6132 family protein n=1 Tax=uncultured Draconibacterium sp. TaxID=1573823 RepID=UPI002AA8EF91|nr:DUF6132 family protein [uncultured Draconibacterium sp.]